MPLAPVHPAPAAPLALGALCVRVVWWIEVRGEPTHELAIAVSVEAGQPVARAVLNGRLVMGPAPLAIEQGEPSSLTHLFAPGILTATLRAPETPQAPWSLVYAATSLLQALGIPGGTYDPPRLAPLAP
ncbi:MAG: hypothetical protein H7Y88_04740 [Phycisphaerales bacterium]|nr:hypothetical protein [Phycisphaerales bacterium]